MSQVKVTVKEVETGKVVRDLGNMSEQKADRVERGLLINMNTEDFYVDQETVNDRGEVIEVEDGEE